MDIIKAFEVSMRSPLPHGYKVTLEGARAGEISLEWGLVEIGSGRQFALKRSVMAGTRIELEGR